MAPKSTKLLGTDCSCSAVSLAPSLDMHSVSTFVLLASRHVANQQSDQASDYIISIYLAFCWAANTLAAPSQVDLHFIIGEIYLTPHPHGLTPCCCHCCAGLR